MPDSISAIPPAFLYLLGALLMPFLRGWLRQTVALAIPLVALGNYFLIEKGVHWQFQLLDFQLILGRADGWSLIFLNIFTILSFCGILYILKDNKALDLAAGLLYAGSAMGVIMAGDLITLFLFWEMLTLGAVMCLIARRTERSGAAAYRYVLMHILGGVILLAGLMIHISSGGSTEFTQIELTGVGPWLMFIGFGINCAWPVVGAWLTDTYPEASFGGVIFMATYTTKTAVYVLARTFPGEEILIWVGVIMATLPLLYAVIENDLRRVLAYGLINQVGIMVIGVGLGTALSLNGTAAHAYCHILYKALLFMALGSIIYRTGKSKATELGGLWRSMPVTCAFCCIGALAMATPLLCGFVSKSMIMSTAAKKGEFIVWAAILFATAGAFYQVGLKVVFRAFFSRKVDHNVQEAPANQLIAMAFVAILCIVVGSFPHSYLYTMLPNPEASYNPYTLSHVTDQIALLLFAGLAFALLIRAGLYPAEVRATNLDFDYVYRKSGKLIYRIFDFSLNHINRIGKTLFVGGIAGGAAKIFDSAPTRLYLAIMQPVWKSQGLTVEQIDDKREDTYREARRGAFPIGITAFLAVILLALLALFTGILNAKS